MPQKKLANDGVVVLAWPPGLHASLQFHNGSSSPQISGVFGVMTSLRGKLHAAQKGSSHDGVVVAG
jgi:hypothetical protein